MTAQLKILLETLENERRYVAKELHDGVAQTTLQLGLQASICRKLLERGNLSMLAQELVELEGHLQLASTQVRGLIAEMRPPQLESEAPLGEYIQQVISLHQERGTPPVAFRAASPPQLPCLSAEQKLTITRIIQEALLNIHKHAQAKHICLTLVGDEDHLVLTVADDGKGFDLAEVESRPVDRGGAGLSNLRARAQAIGGRLTITTAVGAGTEVKLRLPGVAKHKAKGERQKNRGAVKNTPK